MVEQSCFPYPYFHHILLCQGANISDLGSRILRSLYLETLCYNYQPSRALKNGIIPFHGWCAISPNKQRSRSNLFSYQFNFRKGKGEGYDVHYRQRLQSILHLCAQKAFYRHTYKRGNLTFVEVGRRRFLRFPRTSSSLIQIFIECEQQNVATAVTVCVLPDSLERSYSLQKGKEVSLLLSPHSLQSSFCLNPY